MTEPDHNWIADPLAIALIDSIENRPPVPRERKVDSFSSWGKVSDTFYDDGRVKALSRIRDVYGQRCLDWTDSNQPATMSPMNKWCALPDAHTLTSIICSHFYYDPTSQHKAFAEAWHESRRAAA